MDLNAAKQILLNHTETNGRVERSCTNEFVRIGELEHKDSVFRAALEDLIRDGKLERIPTSPGHVRTTISYQRCAKSSNLAPVD